MSAAISTDVSVEHRSTYRPTYQSTYRSTYRPMLDQHPSTDVSVAMSTDISVAHRSICRPTYRPICRSRCRPTYRSRGSQITHDPCNLHEVILIGIENQQKAERRLWSFRAPISGEKRDPANRIGLNKGKACYCRNTGPCPWFWGHQTCWLTKWHVHKSSFSIVTISWHGKLWTIQAAGAVFLYHSSLMWGKWIPSKIILIIILFRYVDKCAGMLLIQRMCVNVDFRLSYTRKVSQLREETMNELSVRKTASNRS